MRTSVLNVIKVCLKCTFKGFRLQGPFLKKKNKQTMMSAEKFKMVFVSIQPPPLKNQSIYDRVNYKSI